MKQHQRQVDYSLTLLHSRSGHCLPDVDICPPTYSAPRTGASASRRVRRGALPVATVRLTSFCFFLTDEAHVSRHRSLKHLVNTVKQTCFLRKDSGPGRRYILSPLRERPEHWFVRERRSSARVNTQPSHTDWPGTCHAPGADGTPGVWSATSVSSTEHPASPSLPRRRTSSSPLPSSCSSPVRSRAVKKRLVDKRSVRHSSILNRAAGPIQAVSVLSQSARAAGTGHHGRRLTHTFLSDTSGGWKLGCQHSFLARALLVHGGPPSHCVLTGRRERALVPSSPHKDTNPILGPHPHDLI